jgi:hypothetical protein
MFLMNGTSSLHAVVNVHVVIEGGTVKELAASTSLQQSYTVQIMTPKKLFDDMNF